MNAYRTAIVISSHCLNESLEACLSGFLGIAGQAGDLIFVDNGSNDGLGGWAAERFPEITFIRLLKNQLFCGGYNAGIRVAMERGYDFILMSNADTQVVNPNFIWDLLTAANRWPRGAFFGPQVFWRNQRIIQRTCLQFPSVYRNAWHWLPWRLARGTLDKQPQAETPAELLNGVCVLCRVEALKEIGLMDENMGGYVEDADWAWRAREKGWISVFTPVPSVIHHETPTGYEPYSLKTFLLKRNTVYWFLKMGRQRSAWTYAQASIALAFMRMLAVGFGEERRRHKYFIQKLTRTYKGLLLREKMGDWFGPPIGPWENGYGN